MIAASDGYNRRPPDRTYKAGGSWPCGRSTLWLNRYFPPFPLMVIPFPSRGPSEDIRLLFRVELKAQQVSFSRHLLFLLTLCMSLFFANSAARYDICLGKREQQARASPRFRQRPCTPLMPHPFAMPTLRTSEVFFFLLSRFPFATF